jgi:hypothetical protein
MKKKRGKTQGKARRRTAKDLTTRKGGGVKAGDGGRVQFQEFHFTKRSDA